MEAGARDAMAIARASYERSCARSDFFQAFYRRLFEVRPEVKPFFANTDFERLHKLLRHAIGLLLIFPAQRETEPTILARVAERHSRRDLGIDPSYYPSFLEALIDTVKRCDPEFTPTVEQAWRTTLAKGFAYLQSKY